MSIFRTRGFDSLIGKGMLVSGELLLDANSTLVIEGEAACSHINVRNRADGKVDTHTTLRVSGYLHAAQPEAGNPDITIHNVVITGKVECNVIRVEGTLAIKTGATLKAKKILYRELIVERGSIMHGEMFHLDHVSEGEIV